MLAMTAGLLTAHTDNTVVVMNQGVSIQAAEGEVVAELIPLEASAAVQEEQAGVVGEAEVLVITTDPWTMSSLRISKPDMANQLATTTPTNI